MLSSVTAIIRSLCLFSILGIRAGKSSSMQSENGNQVDDALM